MFSDSYYSISRYIYTRSDKPFATMASLSGKRLGHIAGNLYETKLLTRWPDIIPAAYSSNQALATALLKGEIEAAISGITLLLTIREDIFPNLELAFTIPDTRKDLCYSVNNTYPELRSIINKALARIGRKEIHAILEKWNAVYKPPLRPALSEEETNWLQQHSLIRARIGDVAPYHFWQRGEARGISVDLLNHIAQQFDFQVEYLADIPWSDALQQIKKRNGLDLLLTAKRTPKRDQFLNFTNNYLELPWMIFTKKSAQDISRLQDLFGKIIAIEKDYVLQKSLERDYPQIRQTLTADAGKALLAVSSGQANAYIGNLPVAQYHISEMGLMNLKVAGTLDFDLHTQAFAVRKDWPQLVSIINKGLTAIPEAQRNAIQRRYLSMEIQTADKTNKRLTLSSEERTYLQSLQLRRAVSIDWEPFSFQDNEGRLVGISEEYWALIREKLQLHETVTGFRLFRDILQDLKQGRSDLHIGTTKVSEREAYLAYSDQYEEYPLAIAMRKDAGFISNAAALVGHDVAVGRDYTAYHLLKARYPAIQFKQVADTAEALQWVADKRAFAAVDILPALQYQLSQFNDHNVVFAGISNVKFPLQIAVRNEHARLVPLINRAIATLSLQERLDIQKNWMSKQVVLHEPDYSALWKVLIPGLLVIVLILYWNRKLAAARAELLRINSHLEAIFANSNAVIGILKQRRFVKINRYLAELFGYSLEELQHQSTRILHLDKKHYQDLGARVYPRLRQDRRCNLEYPFRHRDGRTIWLYLSVSSLEAAGASGNEIALVGVDISERKRIEQALRESRTHYQQLVDDIGPNFVIYRHDAEGVLTHVSKGVENIFGISQEQALGRRFSDIIPWRGDTVKAAFAKIQLMLETKQSAMPFEMQFTRADGSIGTLLVNAHPTRDEEGRFRYIEGITEDITERKRVEQALIKARHAAEAANHAKSAFLANMSHELRTPLNAVLGFAQILQQAPDLPESHKNAVDNIYRGGNYLLTLINDILDLAKIESGHIELYPEETPLQPLLQDLNFMFQQRAEQKNIAFEYHEEGPLPYAIDIDPTRLRQALINLLGNAVKFTTQGKVKLQTSYHDGALHIQVSDTGPGIPPEQHAAIFRPFAQAGESYYKAQGTGLGLAITSKIVQLMNGAIQLDSALGQGARFSLRLPARAHFATPQNAAPSAAFPQAPVIGYQRQDQHNEPLKLLLVDDKASNRKVLNELLQPLGFIIIQADQGGACLELLQNGIVPDLILMDLRMSPLNGLETTCRLHALPGLEKLPVIAVSACAFNEDRKTALEAGCVEHLAKPVQRDKLLQTLETYLPLRWKRDTTTSVSNAPLSSQKTALSAQQRATLLDCLERGDVTQTIDYLEKLLAQPEPPPETAQLLSLAQQFRLQDIKTYLCESIIP